MVATNTASSLDMPGGHPDLEVSRIKDFRIEQPLVTNLVTSERLLGRFKGGRSSSDDSLQEDILIEEDRDYVIEDERLLPFSSLDLLGKGYSAVVEKVNAQPSDCPTS